MLHYRQHPWVRYCRTDHRAYHTLLYELRPAWWRLHRADYKLPSWGCCIRWVEAGSLCLIRESYILDVRRLNFGIDRMALVCYTLITGWGKRIPRVGKRRETDSRPSTTQGSGCEWRTSAWELSPGRQGLARANRSGQSRKPAIFVPKVIKMAIVFRYRETGS